METFANNQSENGCTVALIISYMETDSLSLYIGFILIGSVLVHGRSEEAEITYLAISQHTGHFAGLENMGHTIHVNISFSLK
jgi:hypothetical protein